MYRTGGRIMSIHHGVCAEKIGDNHTICFPNEIRNRGVEGGQVSITQQRKGFILLHVSAGLILFIFTKIRHGTSGGQSGEEKKGAGVESQRNSFFGSVRLSFRQLTLAVLWSGTSMCHK